MTRVLVCGGRSYGVVPKDQNGPEASPGKTRAYHDSQFLFETLDGIHAQTPISFLIEGGAYGADYLAFRWRTSRKVPGKRFPANWRPEGKAGPIDYQAGPARNAKMLEEGKPDLVIAFRGGRGTDNMVKQARSAGVTVMKATQSDLESCAKLFATAAHGATGQVRKYTGNPYIGHPAAVAALVRSVPHSPEMLAAAWLHDVVEDTSVGIDAIKYNFGHHVAVLVEDLTDPSRPEDGNRAERRAIDRAHSAAACPAAKTIKLADIIDNAASVAQHDPSFADVYLSEIALLLEVLKEGDPTLYARAVETVAEAKRSMAA